MERFAFYGGVLFILMVFGSILTPESVLGSAGIDKKVIPPGLLPTALLLFTLPNLLVFVAWSEAFREFMGKVKPATGFVLVAIVSCLLQAFLAAIGYLSLPQSGISWAISLPGLFWITGSAFYFRYECRLNAPI